jgi:hypothetical protein
MWGRRETMSEQSKDGGPAFPVHWEHERGSGGFLGMSLRDWFAGQVICAAITWGDANSISERAYDIADAMLARRSTPPSKG